MDLCKQTKSENPGFSVIFHNLRNLTNDLNPNPAVGYLKNDAWELIAKCLLKTACNLKDEHQSI